MAIAVIAVILAKSTLILAACGVLLTAVLLIQRRARSFVTFLVRIWSIISVSLFIVWGLIFQGSPSAGAGSGAMLGLNFALLISLRLALFAGLFHLAFGNLRGVELSAFLSKLGLSHHAVAVVVSIFNLWPNFQRRVEEIVAARCARGMMPDRSILTRLTQFPFVLRTLFASTLGDSLDRAVRWEREELPQRLYHISMHAGVATGNIFGSIISVALALCWLFTLLWPSIDGLLIQYISTFKVGQR